MDIRSKAVGDKYREAKKFVEEYEAQYHKELCTWTPLEHQIFDVKEELSDIHFFCKEYPGICRGREVRARKRLYKLLKEKHK